MLELIDKPERFMGNRRTRIGAPSSLCVEITDSSSNVTGPCAAQQVEVDPPIVEGTPRVSEAGVDGRWLEGETVEVTLAFSESVTVDTANGVPSVGIGLGGPTPARSAAWLRGSGTTELVFGYTLVQGDGDHTVMAVAPDSLALNGGAIRSVATGADAALAHVGTLVQARPARAPEGPRARFDSLPEGHDGATAFTVELHFSAAPAGLSAKTDAASVLEVTGGTVTGARQTAEDVNPAWEVTVTPNGLGDVTVRVPVRACIETNAVCIGGQPLSEGATAVVPGTSMTASFTQAPAAHDGSNGFDLHMEFSHEPNSFSYRTVRDALFDLVDGRIERVWRRERGKNRLWGITVVPDGQGPVTLTARATTDCTAQYAACNIDGRKFAGNLRLTVPGPRTLPMVSIAPSTSPVTEGAAAAFSLARTGAAAAALTVAVSVSESEAAVSGTPPTSVTFAAGSASATLSVATEDDEATEDASTVTATVLSGSGYTLDVTSTSAGVVVNDDDAAPVVSTTSPVVVAENVTPVATLTATDADTAVADLSWSIPVAAPGGADGAKFALTTDGALSFKAAKDFEAPDDADADGDYEITVRVTDGANPIDASLVVRLSDVDDAAPVVSTTSPVMVAENVTTVAMLTATDADTAVADLSWSIPVGAPGGADRAKFALTTDGALSFKAAKDFEAPDDADADGDYEITVRVTDGANPVDASLVVRLSDVDDAAPTLSSASVDGAVLTLTFSKALDTASQPAESSFAVAVGGTARTVDAVAVAEKVVTLTLSSVVTSGQIVTVDYTVPTGAGAKPVQDGAGNRAASFANTEVRNLTAAALPEVSIAPAMTPVTEGAAAAFSLARTGAAAAALTVAVSVSESEAAVSGTPPTSVTFAAGSASATLSVATEDDEATEDASTVTATVLSGSGYTLDVTSMSAGVVVNDDDAAPVVSTTSPVVVAENVTPVATLTATDADTAVADLSWSIPVAAPGGADGAKFALTTDGALSFKAAKDFEAPDDADADGDYEITVRVTDGANPIDASLVVRLSDVDDAAPVVSTTSPVMVAENVTTVAMLTATDADTAVADLSWSIPVGAPGGADRAKFALTTDGALSFKAAKDFEAPDDADADGDYEITVRVTDGANPVDASLVVRLSDVDDAAPTLSSASVDGALLTLTFSKALDTASQPAESSFAVAVGGTARTVDAVAVAEKVVTLTLSSVVTSGQIVTVDYTVPTGAGAKPVQDGAGNRAASFANTEVRNLTAAALPEVSIAPAMTPVTEGTAAAFVLRRTGATDDALTVTVTVSEAGSVLSGAPPSSATFAAGLAEARLSVATVNDAVDEADTRVRASVVAGDGYEVDGESASAGVDVFDDDAAAQAAAVELWSTTMTWTDIGNNWFGGFSDAFSNPVWSEDGQDFRIWFISYDAGARALLMMHDGSGGRIAEPGQLALHVGGLTVGPGEAMSEFAGAGYARLGGVGSQWQVGEQVTVRLTRTSDEAASAPAGPGLSVADAQVNEAAGAPLRFRVTLDAPAESVVSVRYGTANGTALAGEDYVAARGAVRFARGEIEKTVEVAVLPDDHDEGSETMTLALSGPYGAAIADGTATGTISNEGAIPKAWIARFGRTVAEQAIEAVEARFEAPRAPGLSGTIGGQSISGIAGPGPEAGEVRGAGTDARQGLEALSDWFGGESGDEDELGIGTRTLSGREVLTGTSLGFTAGTAETGFAAFWGRGAVTSFDGRDGEMTLDGEVASAMVGADFSRDALLGGLMLSHSRGEGGYRSPDDNGEVESTLTALYPYARYALSERVSVWGMVGYGEGTLTVTREGTAPLRTDMDFLMGALGGRGVLLDGGHDGATLAAKSDAFAVRTSTDAVSGLKAAEADVTRVRFALEGSRPFGLGGDAVLTPSLELGVRHDGGDAETGFGADIGAGLVLSDPARGISAEVRARGLLTHEAEGMRERGLSGTLAFDPAPDTERGLSLSLTQSVGAQGEGGVDALLERRTLANLGAEEEDDLSARRLDARIGYGLGILDDRYTATPELGLGLSDRDREIRLGWRMTERVTTGLAFEFGLEGTRREFMGDDAGPEHSLDVGLGWTLQGSRGGDAFSMRLEAARLEVANDDRPPERRIGLEFTARW